MRAMLACRRSAPALALLALAPAAWAQRFTVVGLPDTQNYSESYPEIFADQTRWIADNARAERIRFVSHYGDLVNHGDRLNEWTNAKNAMRNLDRANIRYGVVPGNHDVTPSGGSGQPFIPENYLANFGPQNFARKSWYKGASPSGLSSWQVFSAGQGRQILALHVSVDAPLNELVWAQGVLNANADKPVMMTTHRYLQDAQDYTGDIPLVPSGRYPDIWYNVEGLYDPSGLQSELIFESFVRRNRIFLVNCGHFHEEFNQTSTNIFGSAVHEVLADYQDDPNGGNGFLRLMRFDVARQRIDVESYSPWLDQSLDKAESRFSLNVNLDDYRRTLPTARFQNGVGGYEGTVDTWISEGDRGRSFGNDQTIISDDDVNNSIFSDRRGQALLRFDGIFTGTGEPGRIPLGSSIDSATLMLTLADDIDFLFDVGFDVYTITRPWDESSTWDSLGGGLSGGELGLRVASFDGDNNPDGEFLRLIDVTQAVQQWADGSANWGFAILPQIVSGNDDGIEIWSSEAAFTLWRPALEVSWYGGLVPAPGSAALLALAGLVGSRRRRS